MEKITSYTLFEIEQEHYLHLGLTKHTQTHEYITSISSNIIKTF